MEKIGKLKQISRYPIKSMKGEKVDKVFVAYSGLTGDRVYSIVNREDDGKFPWVTMRRQSILSMYTPKFEHDLFADFGSELIYPSSEKFNMKVKSPQGKEFDLMNEDFERHLTETLHTRVRIKFSEKGMKDKRCRIVNVDPTTGQTNKQVLAEIVSNHDNTFGVYCVVLKEGVVENGNEVFLVNG